MYKILLTDPIAESAIELLDDAPDVEYKKAYGLSEQEIAKEIKSFNALIVRSATTVTKNILDSAENLRVIGRAGSGLDNIEVAYAEKKGIKVLNTPGTNAPAVAELTIGLIFALARNISKADQSMKKGQWIKKELPGSEISKKKLGIIGCGEIGKLVAHKAFFLGMELLVYNRSDITISGIEFRQVALDKLLIESDFITLHLPKNDDTKGFIGRKEILRMKNGAFLINTARGGMADENALIEFLNNGKLAGAGIDVFQREPEYNKKLAGHPKVIATPHIAASTYESQERVGVQIVDKVVEYLRSKYIFF